MTAGWSSKARSVPDLLGNGFWFWVVGCAQNGFGYLFLCVLSRQVYDVTKFMDDHPGGDDVLLQTAGMIYDM